ncbi:hypothetical protein XOO4708 [Xanthomonas oryzae pv. oryzae KACC 10331]|uniref:Uncharacterized protein n=1 Tax=Xanthomonas oryzae pv. oryzae (strain KACC10331 / KXO85) TaxID=291331 RepID=Q05I66_XANOR|nr:hypothetical protein XOO4708 [Xanthomonas oryzae pv. oryzae KACC 10331]
MRVAWRGGRNAAGSTNLRRSFGAHARTSTGLPHKQ